MDRTNFGAIRGSRDTDEPRPSIGVGVLNQAREFLKPRQCAVNAYSTTMLSALTQLPCRGCSSRVIGQLDGLRLGACCLILHRIAALQGFVEDGENAPGDCR